ncbi:MAG: T9SS type A sorting domain-containing protein [Salinivirgaceae bacterium]
MDSYTGTVTIGTSGDFNSFTEAVDSLKKLGVTGPVTILVDDGTYPEQLIMYEIPGASATNRITFQSVSSDSTKVTLAANSTSTSDNYVVNFAGADYITFSKLKLANSSTGNYGRVINLVGHSHDVTFENNIFIGAGSEYASNDRTVIYSSGQQADNLTVQQNVFTNGSRHVVIAGIDGSPDIPVKGLTISNNTFNKADYNVAVDFGKDLNISQNQFNDFLTGAIYLYYCENPFVIEKNKIKSTSSDDQSIRIENCTGAEGAKIVNNFITINYSSSYSLLGIWLNNSQFIEVLFNSINVVGTHVDNSAIYLGAGSNLTIKNNILAVNGNGYALNKLGSLTNLDCNYNDFYSTGANLIKWESVIYSKLNDYTLATSNDANSLNVNPSFASTTDLHTNSFWLDGQGMQVSAVTDDIDGNVRNNPPCMGADEYTSTLVPLAGTYEIGAGGDFASITEAVFELSQNGISDNVVFEILTGTYIEQFVIPQVFIVDEADSIVFKSKTGIASDVVITFEGTSTANNYIVKLEGADCLTFKNLSFAAANSEYSQCISIIGNIERINFLNCSFQGRTSASTSSNSVIIAAYENEPYLNQVTIDSCTFLNGSWAMDFNGPSTQMENIRIRYNHINSNYKGIYLSDIKAPEIVSNHIIYNMELGYGIKLNNCLSTATKALLLTKNQVYSNYRTTEGSIALINSGGIGSQPALVANNVVQGSNSGLYNSNGIYHYRADYTNFYFNSINLTGNSFTDKALYVDDCDYINIYNNSLAIRGELGNNETGQGYALHINGGVSVVADYNNLYSPGRYIARWNTTDCASITDLKTASSQFANSISVFPSYPAFNNLETKSYFLNSKAQVFSVVTDDILGVVRNTSTPDIGAYEIEISSAPLSGNYTVGIGGSIPTIDSMVQSLLLLGINESVTFNLADGVYENTHFLLRDIPGTGPSDSVIIQSAATDSTKVSLAFAQTQGNNYVFYLNGTDYLTFKHVTFSTSGTGYTRFIVMDGNSNHLNLFNNRFNGVNVTTYNVEQASIYSYSDHIIDHLNIKNNAFNYNGYGVLLNGYTTYKNQNILIEGNYFNNQHTQVYMYRINNPAVVSNTMIQCQGNGIMFDYCTEGIKAIRNRISTSYTNVNGIILNYSDGTGVTPGMIANNFIQCAGLNGLYMYSSDYHNIYHNSINHTGNNSGAALTANYGSNIKIVNNILNATSNGYAYYTNSTTNILESDYNNINTDGTRYAYYNATATDLADWQTKSGKDAHSFEVQPEFMSETDLHLLSFDLMEQAAVLSEITTDIDGELRDLVNPDIGADEIYARPPLVESKEICEGDEIPTLIALGINIKWYSDPELTDLIWTASEFLPSVTESGTYTYYVTQTIGDDESEPTIVTFIIHAAPIIEATVVNIDCQGNTYGFINLTVSGDNEPFFYRWSNESTTEDITKLLPGEYFVTVEDIIGCSSTDSFDITAPEEIVLTMIVNDADCGENNGKATIFAEGGNPPFEYFWTTGDTNSIVDSLYSGIYVATVTDQNGCSKSAIATVNDLGGSLITLDAINNVKCYGGNDGSIAISISGGVTPYNIKWSNGATTEDINGLVAGPYEIAVTDADGCKAVRSIPVSQPDPIQTGLGVFDAQCGQSNGSAVTNVTGGVSPYTYNWSTGTSETGITGLGLGIYAVTVTDANSCETEKSFAVSELDAPVVYVDSIAEGTCGNQDGAIYITAYGGTGSLYTYLWNTGSTQEDLIGVNSGEYSVKVTDTVGCTGATVTEIVAEKPETPQICMVTVDTATNNNEIIWEKPITTDIDYYNIYRESTQSGVYQLIGTRNYENESLFVDENSNAQQRSYRYKISAVNTCGVESELSSHHKTMHLTINLGLNGNINLIWDHYEGFAISTYYIYRFTSELGWVKYDSISSNLTSFTDFDAPTEQLHYFIEIVNVDGCSITKAGNRNTSRSNVGSIMSEGGITYYSVLFKVNSEGNPISGAEVTVAENTQITDVNGETTFTEQTVGSGTMYSVTKEGFQNYIESFTIVDSDITVNVELTPVGVSEMRRSMIKVYPNPNTGHFFVNIKLDDNNVIAYKVYNSLGTLVHFQNSLNTIGNITESIELGNIQKGFYILKIEMNQTVYYYRIIVK